MLESGHEPGGDAGLFPAILAAYERESGALPVENLHRKPADPGAMKSISELMHLIAHSTSRSVAALARAAEAATRSAVSPAITQ